MALNLGDITFGFKADTTGLRNLLEVIRGLSNEVNALADSEDEAGRRMAQVMSKQEKAAAASFTKVENLRQVFKELGVPGEQFAKLTKSLDNLVRALASGALESHKFGRAQAYVTEQLAQGTRAARAFKEEQNRSAAVYNNLARAQQRVADLQARIARSGAGDSAQMIAQTNDALKAYEATLNRGSMSTKQMSRATTDFNAALAVTKRSLADHTAALANVSRQERELDRFRFQQARVLRIAGKAGLPGTTMEPVATAWRDLESVWNTGSAQQKTAAVLTFRNAVDSLNKQISASGAGMKSWAAKLREMERAVILAVGPLSGWGARLAVLAALFESTKFRIAAMIAGFTLAATMLALMARASIRAAMEMEKINAVMISATGSTVLVDREYQFLLETSIRLGQSVRELAPSFASFATSARLSGMAMSETRDIFNSFVEAGTALRLSQEQMGRIFLALEQMMSKGTVQSQELKIQLGQVLPGAFELFAMAIGVSQKELGKLLEQGQVASKDALPKLAKTVRDVFGPGVAMGMQSIQAQLGRFSTALFEVEKSFDRVGKFSLVFRYGLTQVTDVLFKLATNMETVIKTVLSLASAFLIWKFGATVLAGAIAILEVAFWRLVAAITTLSMAKLIAAGLALLPLLGKLALFAGLTAAAYYAWNKVMQSSSTYFDQFEKDVEAQITAWERVGLAAKNVADEVRDSIAEQMRAKVIELSALRDELTTRKELEEYRKKRGWMQGSPMGGAFDKLYDIVFGKKPAGEIQGEIDIVNAAIARLWEQLNRLDKVPKFDPLGTKDGDPAGKAATVIERIKDKIADYLQIRQQLQIIEKGGGRAALEWAESWNEAGRILRDIPKGGDTLARITELLKEAGISGADAQHALAGLFQEYDMGKQIVDEFVRKLKATPDTLREVAEQINAMREAVETSGDNSRVAKRERERLKSIETLREKLFQGTILKDEEIQTILKAYDLWFNKLKDIEDRTKGMEELAKAEEDVAAALGDTFQAGLHKINQEYKEWMDWANLLGRSGDKDVRAIGAALAIAAAEAKELKEQTAAIAQVMERLTINKDFQEALLATKQAMLETDQFMQRVNPFEAMARQTGINEEQIAILEKYRSNLEGVRDALAAAFRWEEAARVNIAIQGITAELAKLKDRADEIANFVRDSFTGAFTELFDDLLIKHQSFGDAMKNFWNNLANDILRIFTQMLAQMMVNALQTSGIIKGISSVFTALFTGGGAPAAGGTPVGAPGGGFVSPTMGQHGMEMRVRGSGGTDSQPVNLRATPGERILMFNAEQQAILRRWLAMMGFGGSESLFHGLLSAASMTGSGMRAMQFGGELLGGDETAMTRSLGRGGGGGGGVQVPININVYHSQDTNVNVQQRQGANGGVDIDFIVDMVERKQANRIQSGRGLAPVLERTYGLGRSSMSWNLR